MSENSKLLVYYCTTFHHLGSELDGNFWTAHSNLEQSSERLCRPAAICQGSVRAEHDRSCALLKYVCKHVNAHVCSIQSTQDCRCTSVGEDVNAHICCQGVVCEDSGRGLQGGMPSQAAPLQ